MKSLSVVFSFLDSETSMTGDLEFRGTLRIDGTLHGGIKTPDTLVVGETATITGEIRAGEVQILGTVLGDIESDGSVEIHEGGVLRGDVQTPRLIINEGGRFDGLSRPVAEAPPEQTSSELEESAIVTAGTTVLPHMTP